MEYNGEILIRCAHKMEIFRNFNSIEKNFIGVGLVFHKMVRHFASETKYGLYVTRWGVRWGRGGSIGESWESWTANVIA